MPMGMMPTRRIGRARAYDVLNNTTGAVVIRNVTAAEVASTYQTSLTADEVIEGVATKSYIDSDSYRVTSHMAIMCTPPTVNTPLADQSGNETVALTPYTFAANAFEGPDLRYSAMLSDGNPLPTWLTFDPLTRTFSGTPDETGTFTIRVRATDPATSLTVSDDFDLTISA